METQAEMMARWESEMDRLTAENAKLRAVIQKIYDADNLDDMWRIAREALEK